MTAASSTSRHVAIGLFVFAGALALVVAALLAVTVSSARSLRGADLAWALASAAPAGATALLAGAAIYGGLRARAEDGPRGTATLSAAAVLVVPNALGGAWAMLIATNNDAKWLCLFSGAAGAIAALLVVVGAVALRRAGQPTSRR